MKSVAGALAALLLLFAVQEAKTTPGQEMDPAPRGAQALQLVSPGTVFAAVQIAPKWW